MIGVYIREDEKNFVQLIQEGIKKYESRTKDTLKSLPKDKSVFLISKGMCRLKCKFKEGTFVGAETLLKMDDDICISGTKYFSDKGKFLYEVYDISPIAPFPIPKNVIMHGRAWCEW